MNSNLQTSISRLMVPVALIGALALVGACASTEKKDLPKVSDDGLALVEGTQVGAAYVQPGADFTQYQRVAITDVEVSFKKNWMRDQNRDRAIPRSQFGLQARKIVEGDAVVGTNNNGIASAA